MGALHAGICGLPRVNDIAVGIALMLFGVGLAFYLGKPLIEPTAPRLPSIDLGWWSDIPQVRAALRINVLFLIGVVLAPILVWALRTTRWGLIIRTAGESADAALAMGYSVNFIRLRATMFGGFLGGIGGSFLSLYYPGSWNEGLSSGQGITAVALVIFARWNPMLCLRRLDPVRRRRRARAGAAIGRLQPRLSFVQRRALHPDPADHDRNLFAEAHAGRRAGGAVDHEVKSCSKWRAKRAARRSATSPPIPIRGRTTAICGRRTPRSIIIDMQTDFCGVGGYVDKMGYDLSLTRAPIEPIKRDARRCARQGLSRHPHPRGPSARSRRSAGEQALALAADRRRHRRSRARAAAFWCAASRAGTSSPNSRRAKASRSSTSRARARSAPPISS